jgi:hypothetical protein
VGSADLEEHSGDGREEPIIGQSIGRPSKPCVKREAEIVRDAYARYRFGARMLEVVIRKRHKIRISHNRIHEEPGKSSFFLYLKRITPIECSEKSVIFKFPIFSSKNFL